MPAPENEIRSLKKLSKIIRKMEVAMLTTVGEDGSLRSRPMVAQTLDHKGNLWFFTDADSPKVGEIRKEVHVNAVFMDPRDHRYVSVSGLAARVGDRGKIKELWKPLYRAWFPNGPEDPSVCLLRVRVVHAECWDSPPALLVEIAGLVRSALGRKPAPAGRMQRLDFRH